MTTHILVLHGIFSNEEKMVGLVTGLQAKLADKSAFTIHSEGYDWKGSVLLGGLSLAEKIKSLWQRAPPPPDIVFVGHSQGGLVCRVAAAALCCRKQLEDGIENEPYIDDIYRSTARDMLGRLATDTIMAQSIRGVIMLATPNTGAFTFGQLSMTGKLVQSSVRLLGVTAGAVNFGDLTTDRLFRILQHVKVPKVQYLSISGSMINRFSALSYADWAHVPLLRRLGLRLSLPNDSAVEDESIDLAKAVLPSEIEDMAAQYKHIRLYRDCSRISHVGIHVDHHVQQLIAAQIRKWARPSEPRQ